MNTTFVNRRLFHSTGRKVGKITDVIHDPHDLEPEWVTVRIGLLRREYLVPVSQIETIAGRLVTSVDRTLVTSTPSIRDHFRPTAEQQSSVLQQYGLDEFDLADTGPGSDPDRRSTSAVAEPPQHGVAGFVVVLDEAVGTTLVQTLDEASGDRPATIHLVVPVGAVSRDMEAFTQRESDSEVTDPAGTFAEWQLSAAIRQLSAHGYAVDGLISGEDPVADVAQLVADDPGVDGVIVSTRSDTISRWLGRDLPARITRACPVPVVAVIVDDTPIAA